MKNTMYRKWKMTLFIVLVLSAACLLAGCGTHTAAHPVNLVIVGGGHSNMPVFSTDCQAVHDSLYDAAYTHGNVTILNCDGSPCVSFQTSIPEASVTGLSTKRQKRMAEQYVAQLQAAYAETSASVPEVNTLGAVTMAARALSASNGPRVLLIMDNGLQTTGYLNFTNGLLNAAPEDIVRALLEVNAIPDLSGTQVLWIGLGDSIAPQQALSERQKSRLREIWESILNAAGAESIVFDGGYSTNMPYEGTPYVSTVPVEETAIHVAAKETVAEPVVEAREPELIETVILDSTRLEFLGNKAEFVDETQAREALEDAAKDLISHPENHAYVIGTAAGSENSDFARSLSEARAQTVKEQLVEMGVTEAQMTTMGLGSGDPWHEYDLDENGNMIEEIARRNRKTIIMDVNSSEALLLP